MTNDATEDLENAMRVLTDLSTRAKAVRNAKLMYAANRAWWQLHDYQKNIAPPAANQGADQ